MAVAIQGEIITLTAAGDSITSRLAIDRLFFSTGATSGATTITANGITVWSGTPTANGITSGFPLFASGTSVDSLTVTTLGTNVTVIILPGSRNQARRSVN